MEIGGISSGIATYFQNFKVPGFKVVKCEKPGFKGAKQRKLRTWDIPPLTDSRDRLRPMPYFARWERNTTPGKLQGLNYVQNFKIARFSNSLALGM